MPVLVCLCKVRRDGSRVVTSFFTRSMMMAPLMFLTLWAIDAPSPRQSDQMIAYDPQSGQVILFGGAADRGSLGDLWAWSGALWIRLSASGPPPRNSGVVAYDSKRRRLVLFGGRNSPSTFHDTWEWDRVTWRRAGSQPGPPPVHSVAFFDPRRRVTVVFGPRFGAGSQPKPLPAETWTWDGAAWTRVSTSTGPGDCIPLGIAGATLFVVKMNESGAPAGPTELWHWTGAGWRPSSIPPPPTTTIAMPATQVAATRDGIILFDGAARTTWIWRRRRWTSIRDQGPSPRYGHQMAYDSRRHRTVLFGGTVTENGQRRKVADTWEWDGRTWKQLD